MSVIERGLYVTVGAADLAVEKVGQLPVVKKVVEQTKELGSKSLLERAREIEPKARARAEKLSVRGEKVVQRLRKDAKQVRKQIEALPDDARKQIKEFPATARKQVSEFRGQVEKRISRTNGKSASKPAPKTSAKTQDSALS